MRKDITPDMYNYNKYPGPQFVTFEHLVKSEDLIFTILENTGEHFDAEAFTHRFSEILLKYDYIVGDWGNEQLRLRGFYRDDSGKSASSKISRLDDYIKEYCNFGCDYFILENPDPREVVFEEDGQYNRRRHSNRKPAEKRRGRNHKADEQSAIVQPLKRKSRSRDRKPRQERERADQNSGKQDHFTIRQKKQK